MPHSFTVETMVRKLGAISDLQMVDVILDNLKSTLAFDATRQEAYTLPPKVIAMSSLVMSNNWRQVANRPMDEEFYTAAVDQTDHVEEIHVIEQIDKS
ncbi:hypothetical protein LSH36_399g06008 [Paralvinella palmiformis]|uniref:Uncharacterized protein n=1 Tax=Paralvinella palmiformis TaxID=53620 RepID=A0AAD9JDH1_9ANNE|nr:hypothetical protein LSH36_399g06008 [Paralvinella palmiformis]